MHSAQQGWKIAAHHSYKEDFCLLFYPITATAVRHIRAEIQPLNNHFPVQPSVPLFQKAPVCSHYTVCRDRHWPDVHNLHIFHRFLPGEISDDSGESFPPANREHCSVLQDWLHVFSFFQIQVLATYFSS